MLRQIIFAVSTMLIFVWCSPSQSAINGGLGVLINGKNGGYTGTLCPETNDNSIPLSYSWLSIAEGACSIPANGYVGASGNYRMYLYIIDQESETTYAYGSTNEFYIDAAKPVGEQNLNISGSAGSGGVYTPSDKIVSVSLCYYLSGPGGEYALYQTPAPRSAGTVCRPASKGNLSPIPVPQPVSCTINKGNSLSVNLGTIDRTLIRTAPGKGKIHSVAFPVACTNGTANMRMELKYTPITINGTQLVKSSTKGIGVAISYNDTILSSTDITTLQFTEGVSNMTLKFEIVRDPSVNAVNIIPGPFTANAVLVMMQQ